MRIPFENPCTVFLGLKVCLVLSAPANRKLRFEEKPLAELYTEPAGEGVSVAMETTLLPPVLMAAWWTSRGTLTQSYESFQRNAGWLFMYFSSFLKHSLLGLHELKELLVCSFRPTDFHLASMSEGCLLPFMLKSHWCLPALFHKWVFLIMLAFRVPGIENEGRTDGKTNWTNILKTFWYLL